jgi:DNA-binding IclR family transcriptional regulator
MFGHLLAPIRSMPTHFAGRTNRCDITSRDTLLERFRSEMRHAPAIALTLRQAARLFNLEPETCERLINALAEEGRIQVRGDGTFRFV